jgi:hypothetical protein
MLMKMKSDMILVAKSYYVLSQHRIMLHFLRYHMLSGYQKVTFYHVCYNSSSLYQSTKCFISFNHFMVALVTKRLLYV